MEQCSDNKTHSESNWLIPITELFVDWMIYILGLNIIEEEKRQQTQATTTCLVVGDASLHLSAPSAIVEDYSSHLILDWHCKRIGSDNPQTLSSSGSAWHYPIDILKL